MTSAAKKTSEGLFEGLYRVIMGWNSVYVTFVIVGTFLGEWKRYEDIPVLGQGQSEE